MLLIFQRQADREIFVSVFVLFQFLPVHSANLPRLITANEPLQEIPVECGCQRAGNGTPLTAHNEPLVASPKIRTSRKFAEGLLLCCLRRQKFRYCATALPSIFMELVRRQLPFLSTPMLRYDRLSVSIKPDRRLSFFLIPFFLPPSSLHVDPPVRSEGATRLRVSERDRRAPRTGKGQR